MTIWKLKVAKEQILTVKMSAEDLPISRDALLSLRQQRPLLSHTPGRRVSDMSREQLQHQQTIPSNASHADVSVKHFDQLLTTFTLEVTLSCELSGKHVLGIAVASLQMM